jgi:hypothetical protein
MATEVKEQTVVVVGKRLQVEGLRQLRAWQGYG